MTDIAEKRSVGRPSLYDPAYCEQVVALGKLGKSTEAIGAILGVGTKTLYNMNGMFETSAKTGENVE